MNEERIKEIAKNKYAEFRPHASSVGLCVDAIKQALAERDAEIIEIINTHILNVDTITDGLEMAQSIATKIEELP